jgi:hypothetical protein
MQVVIIPVFWQTIATDGNDLPQPACITLHVELQLAKKP